MVKKARIYLDTSVFGGFFDKEFEEHTKPLFERIANGEFTVVICQHAAHTGVQYH
jgi:predicted nucleic acid-binding protein